MIRAALRHPHLVVVLVLVAVVFGGVAATRIPADLLPTFETPAVQIVTFYPGMPPEVMERDIMSRLERWTGQSVGISHQEGKAMTGVSIVKDFFREGISMDAAMAQVSSYAMSDMYYLPPGTVPPMIMPFDPTASVPLALVTVSSPTMSEKELYDIAYFELRNRLQSIEGVVAPAVYGGKLRRILAYVDRQALAARALAPMDVVEALRRFNVFIPAGTAKMGDREYQVVTNSMPPAVAELDDVPVETDATGAVVRLGDVGEAKDSAQIQTNVVRINGRRQVYIPIYRQPGANTIQIVDSVRAQLATILARLREMNPAAKELALEVVLDQSIFVRRSLGGLQVAGLLGAALAGLVVLLFLRSLRSTFVVTLAIPIAILATVAGLYFLGHTVNAMTVGGIALAIGILVDQSIVVVENVVRHARMGKPRAVAALDGAREVAVPVLVSTITFVAVFLPILFLTGLARFLFEPLAVACSAAIVASYLLSITLVPAYCARYLRVRAAPDRRESLALRAFGGLVRGALRLRWLVLALAIAGAAGAAWLLGRSGQELFPAVDAGQLTLLVRLPSGTRIEKTEQVLARMEAAIVEVIGEPDPEYPKVERHPDSNLQMLITNIGVLMDWPAAYTPNAGPMDAFVLVQLKGKEGAPGVFATVTKLRALMRERFPEAQVAFDTGGMLTAALNMGEPAPIHLQVSGSKLEPMMEIARTIAREAEKVPGAVDVRVAQSMDQPMIELDIDRTKAALVGVDVEGIVKNLVTATNSSIGFDPAFWIDPKNGNHYFVGAQYAEASIDSVDTLLDVPVRASRSGDAVQSVRDVLRGWRFTEGPSVVNHRNITRVIDVYANVAPGADAGSVVRGIEERLAASELSLTAESGPRGAYFAVHGPFEGQGYQVTASGEIHSMREAFGQLRLGLGIAVLLVFLAMVALFRSFVDPAVVLFAVPLGLVGVAGMLWATDTPLSIQVFMGGIMVVGIVVEYAIILVDFANAGVRAGRAPFEAVVEAAKTRLRPILMTSLTTLLALLPMALGGAGADANVPLARTIIGGVLGATVLTLVVVPCLYVIVKRPLRAAEEVP